ncbi:MAG: aldo/keto reductase [Pseudomonadota bacterium]
MTDHQLLPIRRRTTLANRDVARMAFGTMRLAGAPVAQVGTCLEAARDAGIDVLDTAPIYGAGGPGFGDVEGRIGAAWADTPSLRDAFVLVTKAGIVPGLPYDASAEALTASCEASLRRLRTERIDLFLVHRPDHLAGHAETAAALDQLIVSGKVGAVGVSNYTPAQVRALGRWLDAPLVANQIEASPLAIDALGDGTLDQCEERGIVPMAWSPLGGGRLLSEGADRSEREDAVRVALDRIAVAAGAGLDVAALAWLLAHPAGIVPVLGTGRPERIAAAMQAFEVGLSRPDWYAVLEASRSAPMP